MDKYLLINGGTKKQRHLVHEIAWWFCDKYFNRFKSWNIEIDLEKIEGKVQGWCMHIDGNACHVTIDKRLKGDFELDEHKLSKKNNNNYIYTGCQIINKNLFSQIKNSSFPISNIWNKLLESKLLYGYESYENFTHLTDLEIYKRLSKSN